MIRFGRQIVGFKAVSRSIVTLTLLFLGATAISEAQPAPNKNAFGYVQGISGFEVDVWTRCEGKNVPIGSDAEIKSFVISKLKAKGIRVYDSVPLPHDISGGIFYIKLRVIQAGDEYWYCEETTLSGPVILALDPNKAAKFVALGGDFAGGITDLPHLRKDVYAQISEGVDAFATEYLRENGRA